MDCPSCPPPAAPPPHPPSTSTRSPPWATPSTPSATATCAAPLPRSRASGRRSRRSARPPSGGTTSARRPRSCPPTARSVPPPATRPPAARAWLRDHAAAFGLSAAQVDGLELVNDQRLAGSEARAVLLRQQYDGLPAAAGGLVTVGVADGQVRYVSSSLARSSTVVRPGGRTRPARRLARRGGRRRAPAGRGGRRRRRARRHRHRLDPAHRPRPRPASSRSACAPSRWPTAPSDRCSRPTSSTSSGGAASAYTSLVDAVTGDVLVPPQPGRQRGVQRPLHGCDHRDRVRSAARLRARPTTSPARSTRSPSALPADDVTIKLFGPGDDAARQLATSAPAPRSPPTPRSGGGRDPRRHLLRPGLPLRRRLGRASASTRSRSPPATPPPRRPATRASTPRWRYFPANPTLDSPAETPTNSVVGCWFLPGDGLRHPARRAGQRRRRFGPWDTRRRPACPAPRPSATTPTPTRRGAAR